MVGQGGRERKKEEREEREEEMKKKEKNQRGDSVGKGTHCSRPPSLFVTHEKVEGENRPHKVVL